MILPAVVHAHTHHTEQCVHFFGSSQKRQAQDTIGIDQHVIPFGSRF